MLLAVLVATSEAVGATRSRIAKVTALADLLSLLTPDEVAIAVGFLTGVPRQGRIGVGWATLASIEVVPVDVATLTVGDIDDAVVAVEAISGAGSESSRRAQLHSVLSRATEGEADFIRR